MQDIITEVYELRYCGGKVSIFPYLPYISHTKKYYFQSEYEIFYTSPNNFPEGLLPLNYNDSVYFYVGSHNIPTSLKINTIYENILNTTACLNVNMIVLNDKKYFEISVSLSDRKKKISALQFSYVSDFLTISNEIIIPSFVEYEYLSHNKIDKQFILVFQVGHALHENIFMYIQYDEFTYFQLYDVVVSDDMFPVKKYDIQCI